MTTSPQNYPDLKSQSPAQTENPFTQKNAIQDCRKCVGITDPNRAIAEFKAMIALPNQSSKSNCSNDRILNVALVLLADSAVYNTQQRWC